MKNGKQVFSVWLIEIYIFLKAKANRIRDYLCQFMTFKKRRKRDLKIDDSFRRCLPYKLRLWEKNSEGGNEQADKCL